MIICVCAGQYECLELKCSESSYNWCYIEDHIDLADGEPLEIINAYKYRNTERLETFSRSNITEIPVEFFKIFTNLRHIHVSTGYGITTINPHTLKYAKNLRVLNLISNNIQNVPKFVFAEADNLKQINLKFNNIADVEEYAFGGLEQLQVLHLSYNHLKYLKKNVFSGAPNLIELSLDFNEISTIEDGALNLPHLKTLFLNDNQLVSIADGMFERLPALQNINLSSNLITSISSSFFTHSNMEYINLSNNNLASVELSMFSTMRNLRVLQLAATNVQINTNDLSGNEAVFENNLEILDLSDNELNDEHILQRLIVFKKLLDLNLSNNNLIQIHDIDMAPENFPYLRKISLNHKILVMNSNY